MYKIYLTIFIYYYKLYDNSFHIGKLFIFLKGCRKYWIYINARKKQNVFLAKCKYILKCNEYLNKYFNLMRLI
jgi:hypothetical protein